jgi:hypothetical protein
MELLDWYVPLLLKGEFEDFTHGKKWNVEVDWYNPPALTVIRVIVHFPHWFDDTPVPDAHGCFAFDENETFWGDHELTRDILRLRLHRCLTDIHRLVPLEAA